MHQKVNRIIQKIAASIAIILGALSLFENGTVTKIPLQDNNNHINWTKLEKELKWENREPRLSEFLVDYMVTDGELFFEFFKDDVTMLLPTNIASKGDDIYTIQKGDKVGTFNWLNNYHPATKNWLIAKFVDVTGNGVEELCIKLNLGSGTGVSVTGIHIVDLETMEELHILDPEEYPSLKTEDAMKISDLLQREKEKDSNIHWRDNEIRVNWEQINFKINENGDITLTLGLRDYEQFLSGEVVGYITGKYSYNGATFELTDLAYNPVIN
ncbi:hypothetical protein EDC19_0444 [Natranaerovirga hydrolytica]|uniref:Uncharacterized protein n=1 Tax=Natranaerovirga hydrolytica TaxID=680378 RepID=A0A4R1N5Y1_9FIRM|nr:hypothetical protein [Natranaerovirga hydrolytica]TCK98033.1 hypothetical protein EDC19_0444 [Natranaerovirga hydrolytica]